MIVKIFLRNQLNRSCYCVILASLLVWYFIFYLFINKKFHLLGIVHFLFTFRLAPITIEKTDS